MREVLIMLFRQGWAVVATRGSHRQLKNPSRVGRVTVSGKLGADVPRGTLASILRQAGTSKEES